MAWWKYCKRSLPHMDSGACKLALMEECQNVEKSVAYTHNLILSSMNVNEIAVNRNLEDFLHFAMIEWMKTLYKLMIVNYYNYVEKFDAILKLGIKCSFERLFEISRSLAYI